MTPVNAASFGKVMKVAKQQVNVAINMGSERDNLDLRECEHNKLGLKWTRKLRQYTN